MNALVYNQTWKLDPNYPDPRRASGETLIRVHLAGICGTDLEISKGYMKFSGIAGHEFVGEVIEGSKAWLGKRVVGGINCVCRTCDLCRSGLSNHCRNRTVLGIQGRDGVFAELVTLPEDNLTQVPDHVTDRQAVFAEPLAAALQTLKQCRIDSSTRAAVVGTGRLGLLVAMVLKQTGCNLTACGRNPMTLAFCEKQNIQTRELQAQRARDEYDVVIECTGSPEGFEWAVSLLRPRGTLILKSTYAGQPPIDLAPVVINELTLLGSRCGSIPDAIEVLSRQELDTDSMISKIFPLSRGPEAVSAAANPQQIKVLLAMV